LTDPAAERTGDSTWARLSRRKVVQWGLAYLAGAWGFLQGLEYLTETYDWPTQLRMVAVPALLLGLSIVLVVAWYHGDRGHQRVTRTEFGILTLLFVLGGGAIWRYYLSIEARSPPSSMAAASQSSATDESRLDDPRPSIAVLPFENHSANPDDAYFVDGIQGDILTQLTKVRGLRVIASASTEQLRGTPLSMHEIGRRLGVSKLLQGRVQRDGDRVRINVVLVDTATGSQEWAERYDRSLTGSNILAIQSAVAATVAARLQAGLPAEADTTAPGTAASTRSLEAWDAYHRGEGAGTPEEAEQYFRRAIQADPRFALAYVGLSQSLVSQIYASGARRDVILPEAEAAADTALQIDPELPQAWLASANFFGHRGDAATEEARIRKAIELNPNFAPAYERLADSLLEAGRAEEAVLAAKKGVALDPLSTGLRQSLALGFEALRKFDDAEAQYRHAVDIDPMSPGSLQALAEFEAYERGRFVLAVPLQQKAVQLAPDNAYLVGTLAQLYMDLEDDTRAAELLDEALNRWPDRTNLNVMAALLARYRGDQLSATRYARKVLETSPKHLAGILHLTDADLARGDVAAAREKFAFAYPEFFATVPPEINAGNRGLATAAASILLAAGDPGRARVLLDRSERLIRGLPRLGAQDYVDDATIRALRGDQAGALRALQEAVKAGWRGPFWRIQLLYSRQFAALRGAPEFQAAVAEIRRDLASQRAELERLTEEAPATP
jgi:TolB-like protein/Tfp pilus assembly protein PilF